jgi:hypothetical protein
MTGTSEENLFPTIIKGSIAVLTVMTAIAFLFFSAKTAGGIIAGGTIALLNFIWMRKALEQILGLMPDNPARHSFFRFIARLTATGAALFLILRSELVSLPGLLVGLSIIAVNIIALSLYRALRTGG